MLEQYTGYVQDFYSMDGRGTSLNASYIGGALQQSFDSVVLGGSMTPEQWVQLTSERYPQYQADINAIYGDYMANARTAPMSSPSGSAGGPSATITTASSSILQSTDAAFIAAAVAVLGIALLVMRRS